MEERNVGLEGGGKGAKAAIDGDPGGRGVRGEELGGRSGDGFGVEAVGVVGEVGNWDGCKFRGGVRFWGLGLGVGRVGGALCGVLGKEGGIKGSGACGMGLRKGVGKERFVLDCV